MEGAGVARSAMYQQEPVPRFLEVRGISDFADPEKNDDWRAYAAASAAAFTVGLWRSRPFSPLAASGFTDGSTGKPLLVLRAQSLCQIAGDEVLSAFQGNLKGRRDIETVALDFTDLMSGGALSDPEEAVRRLADPQGALFAALARRDEADLVFHGLVHVPLAFLSGHLVSDRQHVRLFDFHPGPDDGTWVWPNATEQTPQLEVRGLPKRASGRSGEAMVRISISYGVVDAQTRVAVPRPAFEINMTVPEPARGIVRSETQVRQYGGVFREVLDTIAQRLPGVERVHVFYAGPVALAFHLGQLISENIHPPVTVWNFKRGYRWGIDLEAAAIGEPCVILRSDITQTEERNQ